MQVPAIPPMGFWEAMAIHALWAIPPTLMALAALLKVTRSRRDTKQDIHEVHLVINSRVDELVAAAAKLGFSEGVASTHSGNPKS